MLGLSVAEHNPQYNLLVYIYETVICKQTATGFNAVWHVIDETQKQ